MKKYFVEISTDDTKLYFMNEKHEFSPASFYYRDQILFRIYNSCTYSLEDSSLILTPLEPIFEANHQGIFQEKICFCGYQFNFDDIFIRYIRDLLCMIRDKHFELIFLFSPDTIGAGMPSNLRLYQYINAKIQAIINQNNTKSIMLKGVLDLKALKCFALIPFAAEAKAELNYLYLDDDHYVFCAPNLRKGEFYSDQEIWARYEKNDEIRFLDDMKNSNSSLVCNQLIKEDIGRIFEEAYFQYGNDMLRETKVVRCDYEYIINCESVRQKIKLGEDLFQKRMDDLDHDHKTRCIVNIRHPAILEYTLKHLRETFSRIEIIEKPFYYEFLIYALVVIDINCSQYFVKLNGAAKRENGYFFDGKRYYNFNGVVDLTTLRGKINFYRQGYNAKEKSCA